MKDRVVVKVEIFDGQVAWGDVMERVDLMRELEKVTGEMVEIELEVSDGDDINDRE